MLQFLGIVCNLKPIHFILDARAAPKVMPSIRLFGLQLQEASRNRRGEKSEYVIC